MEGNAKLWEQNDIKYGKVDNSCQSRDLKQGGYIQTISSPIWVIKPGAS